MSALLTQGGDQLCLPFKHAAYLSPDDVRQRFDHLVLKQSALAQSELCDLQARLLGPSGTLAKFSRLVAREGRHAAGLSFPIEAQDCRHRALAEQSADFVLSLYRRRKAVDNPFKTLSRNVLRCVVFDNAAPYILAERFAAVEALRDHDSRYFANLIATTRHTVERRLVFIGLLEHFDSLLPMEQSIYPRDYRSAQQFHLSREEALYGRLELDKPMSELLELHTPEWLLENVCPLGAKGILA